MNPCPESMILETLGREGLSPEVRAIAVDFLSGIRSTELADRADDAWKNELFPGIGKAVADLIYFEHRAVESPDLTRMRERARDTLCRLLEADRPFIP